MASLLARVAASELSGKFVPPAAMGSLRGTKVPLDGRKVPQGASLLPAGNELPALTAEALEDRDAEIAENSGQRLAAAE